MNEHLQNGALKDRMTYCSKNLLTRPEIIKITSWIKKFVDIKKHKIYEELQIKNLKRKTKYQ